MVRDGFGPILSYKFCATSVWGVTKCSISRNRLVVRKLIRSQWSNSTIIFICTIAHEVDIIYSSVCVVYRRYYVAPSRTSHI